MFEWPIWAHSTFSQMVILALTNPKIWILALAGHEMILSIIPVPVFYPNFQFYPVIQHKSIFATSQTEKVNFIQLSWSKLHFILLPGKSAVGQPIDGEIVVRKWAVSSAQA